MSQTEAHFLHLRDQQLHMSGQVELAAEQARQQGERVPNDPAAKIDAYMGRLVSHSMMSTVPEDDPVAAATILEKRDRQIGARVIKAEDIPESFYETQRRAAREQGHGDLEINDRFRAEAAKVLQTDQRESLPDWVDYLTDKDSNYPTWFKYYTYRSITKLSDYDKDKGEFPKRSRTTTDPFPGLNREALAYVFDDVSTTLGYLAEERQDQARLPKNEAKLAKDAAKVFEAKLKRADFGKLYAKALAVIGFADPELLKETRGSWVKYHQSDNPKDVQRLSNSLKGYGTGWCTAGEGYARTQLATGDFHVYYTLDKKGVARVPRIAVRMEDGEVAEVRGIVGGSPNAGPAENTRQELEADMIDIAMKKIRDMPGGEEYFRKANDMKHVTAIEAKVKAGEELSEDDLVLLYELDHMVVGFGYGHDPRLGEIIATRNPLEDMRAIIVARPDLSLAKVREMQAANSLRLAGILERSRNGEEISGDDLAFMYGLEGPIVTLPFNGFPKVEDKVDYNVSNKFLKLAEVLEKSGDPLKKVQAAALRKFHEIEMNNKDRKNPVSNEAISLLYDASDRIMHDFRSTLVTAIAQLRSSRHYGSDYTSMQKYQEHRLESIDEKDKGNQELDVDDLTFMYEVNANLAGTSRRQMIEIMLRRNLPADVERLLAQAPQYEVFRDDLTKRAANSARLIEIKKRNEKWPAISDEEFKFVKEQKGWNGTIFSALKDLYMGV